MDRSSEGLDDRPLRAREAHSEPDLVSSDFSSSGWPVGPGAGADEVGGDGEATEYWGN
jgi:hypothetical protein